MLQLVRNPIELCSKLVVSWLALRLAQGKRVVSARLFCSKTRRPSPRGSAASRHSRPTLQSLSPPIDQVPAARTESLPVARSNTGAVPRRPRGEAQLETMLDEDGGRRGAGGGVMCQAICAVQGSGFIQGEREVGQ